MAGTHVSSGRDFRVRQKGRYIEASYRGKVAIFCVEDSKLIPVHTNDVDFALRIRRLFPFDMAYLTGDNMNDGRA